jgi:demethylmenaquinone methyltransferase/2-methoxy-6-polyprenyl-1,4-benzoquinol methylase
MPHNQKPASIQAMFDTLAPTYQRTNTILSWKLDQIWRKTLVQSLLPSTQTVLDLCTGTGDLAELVSRRFPKAAIVGLDFSANMLALAKKKMGVRIPLILGDVLALPFRPSSFDTAVLSYSLRNFKNLPCFFSETFRVLKPNGHAFFLELTKPPSKIMRIFYFFYLSCILPLLGGLSSGHFRAYRYLARSILHFHENQTLVTWMQEAGFQNVQAQPLWGGMSTLFIGTKL